MEDVVILPGAFRNTKLPIPLKDATGNVIGQVVDIEEVEDGVRFKATTDCPFGWHEFEGSIPYNGHR